MKDACGRRAIHKRLPAGGNFNSPPLLRGGERWPLVPQIKGWEWPGSSSEALGLVSRMESSVVQSNPETGPSTQHRLGGRDRGYWNNKPPKSLGRSAGWTPY